MNAQGNRVAIGAPYSDSNGVDSGRVRLYQYDSASTTWVQLGGDLIGEAAGDQFGIAVSISADGLRIAVGARMNNGGGKGLYTGHVRVFEYDGSTLGQIGSDIDGEAAGDMCGSSVALNDDGSRLVIGAIHNDQSGTTNAGHARVFSYEQGVTDWVQLGSDIDIAEVGVNNQEWGQSVAINAAGSRIVVGTSVANGNFGAARALEYNGAEWSPLGGFFNGESHNDVLGWASAMDASGNRIALGAYQYYNGGVQKAGYVQVFDYDGSNWVQLGATIEGEAAGDYFGFAVAINADGSHVAVGAPYHEWPSDKSGHVRVLGWPMPPSAPPAASPSAPPELSMGGDPVVKSNKLTLFRFRGPKARKKHGDKRHRAA
jgi:hypothetical protein